MVDTDGEGEAENSTFNKDGEILRPGRIGAGDAGDGVNVMNIKTREFRYNSVKKNEGKIVPEPASVEDLPQFNNKNVKAPPLDLE